MVKATEIVEEEIRPLKRRNLTLKQKKIASVFGLYNSSTHQDEGFDDVDIHIIVEECMRNVDQHSSFAFSEVVTHGNRF
jgi:hypothetical protein